MNGTSKVVFVVHYKFKGQSKWHPEAIFGSRVLAEEWMFHRALKDRHNRTYEIVERTMCAQDYKPSEGYTPADGAEAEDLRREIEELVNWYSSMLGHDTPCLKVAWKLQDLLDQVDARDSLRYLEQRGRGNRPQTEDDEIPF